MKVKWWQMVANRGISWQMQIKANDGKSRSNDGKSWSNDGKSWSNDGKLTLHGILE